MPIKVKFQNLADADSAPCEEIFNFAEVKIGRSPGNDLVLSAAEVSGVHARLYLESAAMPNSRGFELYIVDLLSSNGTYLEDVKLTPCEPALLEPEKRLIIGSYLLTAEYQSDVVQVSTAEVKTGPEVETSSSQAVSAAESEAPQEEEQHEAIDQEQSLATAGAVAVSPSVAQYRGLADFISDETAEALIIDSAQRVFREAQGVLTPYPSFFLNEEALREELGKLLAQHGVQARATGECLSTRLGNSLYLSCVLTPDGTSGISAVLRKCQDYDLTLGDLIERGAISIDAAQLLEEQVARGASILITGDIGLGKRAVLSALCFAIPLAQRAVLLGRASQLAPGLEHLIRIPGPAAVVGLSSFFPHVKALRAERLVITRWADTLATGLVEQAIRAPFALLLTSDANSPEAAVECCLAEAKCGYRLLAQAINLIVHCANNEQGRLVVESISRLVPTAGEIPELKYAYRRMDEIES